MSWAKPPTGFYKVNVGGVPEFEKDECDVGCLIRNDDDDYYRSLGGVFECGDPIVASLQVIELGLEFAWEKGIRKLVLETDDAAALDKVRNSKRWYKYRALVGAINQRMDAEWENLYMDVVPPSMNGVAAALVDFCFEHKVPLGELPECPAPVKAVVEEEM